MMWAVRHFGKEPLTPILKLAKKKSFAYIEALLVNKSDVALSSWLEDASFSKTDRIIRSFKGQTVLHMIMEYHPPAKVVDLLIRKLSLQRPGTVPEDVADMQGKTPLHFAVLHGCDVAVVQRLMKGVVSGAVSKDEMHRLPLHWACLHSAGTVYQTKEGWGCCGNIRSEKHRGQQNMIQIVESLVNVYPHAVFVGDKDGKSPLDNATENNANSTILNLLQKTQKKLEKKAELADHSKSSATADTEQLDLPAQITNHCKCDDVSSMGTRGASVFRKKIRRLSRRPLNNSQSHRSRSSTKFQRVLI